VFCRIKYVCVMCVLNSVDLFFFAKIKIITGIMLTNSQITD